MKKLNIGKSVLQNKALMTERYGEGKFGRILYYLISGLSCSTLYAFIYARNDGLYHFSKSDLKPDSYSNFIWASFLKNPSMKTLVISQKGRFELEYPEVAVPKNKKIPTFSDPKIFFSYIVG